LLFRSFFFFFLQRAGSRDKTISTIVATSFLLKLVNSNNIYIYICIEDLSLEVVGVAEVVIISFCCLSFVGIDVVDIL